jgi:uncharacterized cupin superfamily protein
MPLNKHSALTIDGRPILVNMPVHPKPTRLPIYLRAKGAPQQTPAQAASPSLHLSRYEVGLRRLQPGRTGAPPVAHKIGETVVYVLEGTGKVWQDEEIEDIAAGDCIAWLGEAGGIAHLFVNDRNNNKDLVLPECVQVGLHDSGWTRTNP